MAKNRTNIPTKYQPQLIEKDRYAWWQEQGFFHADLNSSKPPFSIILPPPNVTGKLHIGHAWDSSLQDAIIRFKKLNGFDTLYLPGTDHAGIATQSKVEALLREQGINRFEIGREQFLTEAWKWKDKYSEIIHEQWAKLGLALDTNLENFTLNPEINDLVKHIFVLLYQEGLIYRGKKIVNWDPLQKTAISNIEVIYQEVEGTMYYFKYQIVGQNDYLTIATTRPETMFADQAVAVNPQDQRYQHLTGQKVINPVNQQIIPIIFDSYVDLNFGTGAMKVTPAHDLNDFEIGIRHNLNQTLCLNTDGSVNELGGDKYQGLDRFAARAAIVKTARVEKTLIKTEKIIHQVGYSERSQAVVEPYLSNQWFVKMQPLAQSVLDLQKSQNKINFIPPRFQKELEIWMESALDWTISRQLWWGHQIPAWYHKQTAEIYVGSTPPKDLENWEQDPDVLDTWFSSALWPFATLKWSPTKLDPWFKRYYPTNVLVTGYDIIFFWVARMIFQGWHFTQQKPFNEVLIHGLVRDENGRKMSKSLGNGIDPMDVINEYGTDSLRFFLLTNSTPGQDIKYNQEKIRNAWNFMNKLWNAARYVFLNLPADFQFQEDQFLKTSNWTITNQWILTELTKTMNQVQKLMNRYEFALAGKEIYDFVWTKYCSWFIEFAKVNLTGSDQILADSTRQVLVYVLKNILIMLHPYAPFISESLYQELGLKESIMLETWNEQPFKFSTDYLNLVISLITVIREFRHHHQLKSNLLLSFSLTNLNAEHQQIFTNHCALINQFLLAFVNAEILQQKSNSQEVSSIPVAEFFLEIGVDQFINPQEMFNNLQARQKELNQEIQRSEKLLNNPNFIQKASPDKIQIEKEKYATYQEQLKNINLKLDNLKQK